MRPLAVIVGTMLALPAAAASLGAQDSTLWAWRSPAPVHAFSVMPTGAVIAVSDSGVVVLHPDDGHILWSRREADGFQGLGTMDRMVLSSGGLGQIVDLDTGAVRWGLAGIGLARADRYLALPDRNLLIIQGERDEFETIVGVSLDSGVVRWRRDSLVSPASSGRKFALAGAQRLLLDSDTTFVAFPSSGGVVRVNTRSGAILWRTAAHPDAKPPQSQSGYASMVADGDLILVPYERRLMALWSAHGTVAWDRHTDFPSTLAEIRPTPQGILVRGFYKKSKPTIETVAFLDLLDPATGESRWPKPVRDLHDASVMLVRGDSVYLASAGHLFRIAIATGEIAADTRFAFPGEETPVSVEEREGELVLGSEHNLVRLAFDGTPRYELHYAPPGSSLFSKIAGVSLLVGTSVLASRGGYHPVVVPGSAVPVQLVSARLRDQIVADSFVHVFTGDRDASGRRGFSVVRLEKGSGKEAGRVWLRDRSPEYAVDAARGAVYVLEDDRTLKALRF